MLGLNVIKNGFIDHRQSQSIETIQIANFKVIIQSWYINLLNEKWDHKVMNTSAKSFLVPTQVHSKFVFTLFCFWETVDMTSALPREPKNSAWAHGLVEGLVYEKHSSEHQEWRNRFLIWKSKRPLDHFGTTNWPFRPF